MVHENENPPYQGIENDTPKNWILTIGKHDVSIHSNNSGTLAYIDDTDGKWRENAILMYEAPNLLATLEEIAAITSREMVEAEDMVTMIQNLVQAAITKLHRESPNRLTTSSYMNPLCTIFI